MTNRLGSGEVLPEGEALTSPNEAHRLVLQGDGNLVLYEHNQVLWATDTEGETIEQCIMRADGNFVLYGPGDEVEFATDSEGHPGSYLLVRDDGNVVIRTEPTLKTTALWATGTEQVAPPRLDQISSDGGASDRLEADHVLPLGKELISRNGIYRLAMQGDGRLVLYAQDEVLWEPPTNGRTIERCIMQADGNFVLYGPGDEVVFATNSEGHPGSYLVMQDDGNVVLYDDPSSETTVIWDTGTQHETRLYAGQLIHVNEALISQNGIYRFVLQGDGNLVLYEHDRVLWATDTEGKTIERCIMRADGNLVLYGPSEKVEFATNSEGHPGSYLVVRDDGNVAIYPTAGAGRSATWQTPTVGWFITCPDERAYAGGPEMRAGMGGFEYPTAYWKNEFQIDGRDVVVQLWKGRVTLPVRHHLYAGEAGAMDGCDPLGGVGAEIGIYHTTDARGTSWSPDYEHKYQLSYELLDPSTREILFSASAENAWWLHQWMRKEAYGSRPGSKRKPWKYTMRWRVEGETEIWHGEWKDGGGIGGRSTQNPESPRCTKKVIVQPPAGQSAG